MIHLDPSVIPVVPKDPNIRNELSIFCASKMQDFYLSEIFFH